jgi:hypothetical protein
MIGDRQYYLARTSTSLVLSRAIILHSLTFASASDVVLGMILDQETEIIHYHSSQLRFFLFNFYILMI